MSTFVAPTLERAAIHWLRFDRRCLFVATERSPREHICGRPDVLGVTQHRYAIEVEIKRSLSDFRADAKKASRRNREYCLERFPKQFFYLVPGELVETVRPEIPKWAGLLSPAVRRFGYVQVVKKGPANKVSKRYSLRECIMLAYHCTNELYATREACENLRALMANPCRADEWVTAPWNINAHDHYQI